MVVFNVRKRQAYGWVVRLRLDQSHGGEGWSQEALAPIRQRFQIQSRNFGSNDPRKWMVVASSVQNDTEVGGLDRALIVQTEQAQGIDGKVDIPASAKDE
ncbi:hypothetical protein G7Y89_g3820 [Cudoniella acicularis]|uniref:Uncharacterized protein n=1 Tax=Cudoniella acicularis TaxID=354080 RepID=A0A8H4W7A7_9HELO|nr:hypothetical protein G7Y89_g3820 [Cudoniella acicularis]